MTPRSPLYLLSAGLSMLVLVGCSSTPKTSGTGAPISSVDGTSTGSYSAVDYFGQGNTGLAQEGGIPEGEEFEDGTETPAGPAVGSTDVRTIFFDYDSSEVRADYQPVVLAHGQALAANPALSVTVEGHCDERGSREYNIALGERRANTVKRLMMSQGAQDNQIVTISYGEERPAVLGSSDQSWARNRRVELVY